MEVTINEKKYEVIKNYREGFNLEDVQNRMTDYFDDFDFCVYLFFR